MLLDWCGTVMVGGDARRIANIDSRGGPYMAPIDANSSNTLRPLTYKFVKKAQSSSSHAFRATHVLETFSITRVTLRGLGGPRSKNLMV